MQRFGYNNRRTERYVKIKKGVTVHRIKKEILMNKTSHKSNVF